MSWLDSLERLHNRASDTRFVWFPFERLRPRTDEFISLSRRVVMALTFGGYSCVFVIGKRLLLGEPIHPDATARTATLAVAVFYAWFSLVTAPLWNRRARRMRRQSRAAP